MMSIFSYAYWTSVCLLQKRAYCISSPHYLIRFWMCLIFLSYLNILGIIRLLIWFVESKYFLPFSWMSFSFSLCFFCIAKMLWGGLFVSVSFANDECFQSLKTPLRCKSWSSALPIFSSVYFKDSDLKISCFKIWRVQMLLWVNLLCYYIPKSYTNL